MTATAGGAAGSRARELGALAVAMALAMVLASHARAAANPQLTPTYIPNGFVHDERPASLVDETLAQLDSYGIGQAILPMPKLARDGTIRIPRKETRMIPLWVARTAAYNAAHGTHIVLVGVLDGRTKGKSLDLEEAGVRAHVVSSIETILSMGIGGVQLDFEPYPHSPGFVALLREIDGAFARLGFDGPLSVTAPAHLATWPPAYLSEVTAHLSEVDPLFYDGEFSSATAYQRWVREGLAYYSANAASSARIVPMIPSYGANRWHSPSIEDVASATGALREALEAGSRVNGAGVFWWWGFFYDEEGAYDAAGDRAAWPTALALPFTP